ncbi:MAG: DUF4276 family protein [Synechococcaceae cyanobacterium SM1_2_3]|nr:DUF4276 family protein [Synechococcaceae cyanobacterium SM1_2_3]
MSRMVFLLEEPSMKHLLQGLLPRLMPNLNFLCIPHEGKTDLERSIPRKLKAWNEPGDRFVIVRDNDNGDCLGLKKRLRTLCEQGGHSAALIRLPCQELEAWYLGDLKALADAYACPRLARLTDKAKYRNPDAISKPAEVIEKLVPEFQKQTAARRMGTRLSEEDNLSRSFQVFLAGVRRLAAEMGCGPEVGFAGVQSDLER